MAQQANGTTTTASTVTLEQLAAELATLRAQNAKLQAQVAAGRPKPTMRVGDKGTACFYGLGRYPVALYYSQWQVLLDNTSMISEWLEANKASLAIKES